jgi:hypothetical protein
MMPAAESWSSGGAEGILSMGPSEGDVLDMPVYVTHDKKYIEHLEKCRDEIEKLDTYFATTFGVCPEDSEFPKGLAERVIRLLEEGRYPTKLDWILNVNKGRVK